MRRLLLPIFILLLFLSSCATKVPISYVSPSEVDLSGRRNLAVASTIPYKGFNRPSSYIRVLDEASLKSFGMIFSSYDYRLKDTVAAYATEKLVSTIGSSGYFSILPPAETDRILSSSDQGRLFRQKGVDAVLIPKIEEMGMNEYIYSKERKEKVIDKETGQVVEKVEREYYYSYSLNLTFSYTIIDTHSDRIVARKTFHSSASDEMEISDLYFLPSSPFSVYARLIDSMQSTIAANLMPQDKVIYENLMDNKPKLESLEPAYSLVKDGRYPEARALFLSGWEENRHRPSAYNAALLYAASGNFEEAHALLEMALAVYPGDKDLKRLSSLLLSIDEENRKGLGQLEGSSVKNLEYQTSIYDDILSY